jgi:hypothetical protein
MEGSWVGRRILCLHPVLLPYKGHILRMNGEQKKKGLKMKVEGKCPKEID